MIPLDSSREIVERAVMDFKPYATVLMMSGGDDSLTAYHVARALGVKVDFILHGITGTGVEETTNFVRQLGVDSGCRYIEASAGNAYEQYVLRKGFFGVGEDAHKFAYHILKQQRFRAAVSQHIRHRKHNRLVLLINGARWQESKNRERLRNQPVKADGPNVWVNIVNDWSKLDCLEFLDGKQRNPVTQLVHRSAECMCGTMQDSEARKEVSFWFPAWGKWLDGLERRVCQRYPWKWGEDMPDWYKQMNQGQTAFTGDGWLPMCQSCQFLRRHGA